MTDKPTTRLVWDLPTRLFHWLLALSLLASYVTAKIGYDARQLHLWLGYWMIGLLAFRIVWGFVGTRHARFLAFFPTPGRVVAYLKRVARGEAKETVGHNPLGSIMIFMTLALLSLQAVSGLFVDDEIMFAGPYAMAVSVEFASWMNRIHHTAINLILVLVGIHIAAVLYHVLVKKEGLIRAMFSGRKSADVVPEEESIGHSRLGMAFAVGVVVAGLTYWMTLGA
ncbi:MAG: cytochrome b/b6 domain-containing protein [Pseudomonadota bacterium]